MTLEPFWVIYKLLACMHAPQNTCYFNAMLDTSYTQLYSEAMANEYLLKTKDGRPYNYSYVAAG